MAHRYEQRVQDAVEEVEEGSRDVDDWKERQDIRKKAVEALPEGCQRYFADMLHERVGEIEKKRLEKEKRMFVETEAYRKLQMAVRDEAFRYMEREAFIKKKKDVDDKMNKESRQRMNADTKKHVREYLKTETYQKMKIEIIKEVKEKTSASRKTEKAENGVGKETVELPQPEQKQEDVVENQPANNEKDGEELDVGEAFEVVENIEGL